MRRYCLIIFTVFLLVSCNTGKYSDDGKSVFRYNEAAGITSLDPAFAKDLANIWACNQLFNGLVQMNDKLIAEPCIARYWTISGDGLVYTFFLRNDVSFHDDPVFKDGKGRKVTAYDFEYSFKRIAGNSTASPGAWVFSNVKKEGETFAFHALNDTTFSIALNQPFPPFIGLLAMQYCSVIPEEAISKYGNDFRRHPVGTGPFVFKFWEEGVKLVFVKNDHYFETENGESLPYLDAVAISFLKDKQAAFFEFVKGNLDFLSGIDASYKDELLTQSGHLNPEYEDRFRLITEPYLNTEYLGILVDTSMPVVRKSPLKDIRIRKAINYGIDRRKMMKYLRNNIGTPGLYGIIPPGMPGFDSLEMKGYDYNPDSSRYYLRSAGYINSDSLPDITLFTTADYVDLCKYIQHALSEVGITIKIDVNPAATLKELKAQAKAPFFRASWIADYTDAENYLSLFYSKNFCPAGPNYCHFSDAAFDDYYNKSLRSENDSIRFDNYQKMNKIMMAQSPVIILYYDQVLRFVKKDIKDLGINPVNLLTLKRVKK